MPEQHSKGGCQCGAVTYETEVDISNAITCNCSRCQRLGFVLAFTSLEKFNLLSGKDNLTEYLFNNKTIQHLFCKTCGVESFSYGQLPDGSKMAAVNLNCLEGIEPRELNTMHFDGRNT